MIVLAGFLLLFIIFVFSVFYGTIQEGFGLNDYHWVKDENNEWVIQKVERTQNTHEDVSLDSVAFDLSEPYVESLRLNTDGSIEDGYVKAGNKMLKLSMLPDIILKSNGKVINGFIRVGDSKMVELPKDTNQASSNSLPTYELPSDGIVPEGYILFGENKMVKQSDIDTALAEDMEILSGEITKKKIEDKKPLLASGVLPKGYYKLDQYYMASIPDHYYIYDSDHMAEIPTGYQASEDKTYIFRISDETQSMIKRSNSYTATDLSTYRPDSGKFTSSTVPYANPQSRDPIQFSLDGQKNTFRNDDSYYINTLINQDNDSIREQRNESGTMGDYRASPSYSFYDNHTIITAKTLHDTPGMRGGFCVQHGHSQLELEKQCSKLDKDMCASTNCCVLLGNDTCVTGNEHGPSYQDHYRNPLIQNRDYYYYKGKCYGNCKHQF